MILGNLIKGKRNAWLLVYVSQSDRRSELAQRLTITIHYYKHWRFIWESVSCRENYTIGNEDSRKFVDCRSLSLREGYRFGDEERTVMHLVPAAAVRLMKRRVLYRPGARQNEMVSLRSFL